MLSAPVTAMDLTVAPGELSRNLVAMQNTKDTRLVLTGNADVRDLALLRQISRTVTDIDMSGLEIEAYTYTDGDYMGRTSFAAGEIPPYMLMGCGIKSFTFPRNVVSIGESAFAATGLVTVNIPVSVKSVGSYAFANCASLTGFSITEPVTLGAGVLKDCASLSNATFEYDILNIPESMFDGCSAYSQGVPDSVTSIGAYAFRGTAIKEVRIEKVTSIGDYAFANIPALKSVSLSATEDIKIGRGVFLNDHGIETLPVWAGNVGDAAMAHTAGISKSVINSERIGVGAYANNTKLDTVILGSDVKSIDSHAFRHDKSLKVVDVNRRGKNVIDVKEDSFSGLLNDEGKYDISLYVAKDDQAPWKAHPVWSLFNIVNGQSGITDNIADSATELTVVKRGDVLAVNASEPIDYIGVFDLSGMKVYEATPGATEIEISGLPAGEVLVVKAISAGIIKVVKVM